MKLANYHIHVCPRCGREWAHTVAACKDSALKRLVCHICRYRAKKAGESRCAKSSKRSTGRT